MTTINVELPSNHDHPTIEVELDELHYIEADDTAFRRLDGLLDFDQAWNIAQKWCAAMTEASGSLYAATTGGDPEGSDGLEIIIAFSDSESISFSSWREDASHPDFSVYGYSLDAFPFELPIAVAPVTLADEWAELGNDHLLGIARTLFDGSTPDENPEYRRGVVELISRQWQGNFERETDIDELMEFVSTLLVAAKEV